MCMLGNTHALQIVHGQLISFLLWNLSYPGRCQRAVLQYGQMWKEIEVLEDHTDFGAHALNVTNVIIKMDTVNNNAALLMIFQMVDTADRRRFAGAGRSAQYDAFT